MNADTNSAVAEPLRASKQLPNNIWEKLMFGFCVLFGIAIIINTQAANDGGWYWYAYLLHHGNHLYSGMHLPLQPLFVLETDAFLNLFGKGWLVSKIPAVLHVIAYSYGLLIVLRRSSLSDGKRAILLGCAFCLSVCSPLIRFDDYHVLQDCFTVYSLALLLMLEEASGLRRNFALVAILGVLSGLAIENRINDGAALFAGVAISIACLAPSKKLLSIASFSLAAVLTAVLVVSLTGDSLRDYLSNSLFHAAGSKGGTGHILVYPIRLPINTFEWLKENSYYKMAAFAVVAALIWTFLFRPLIRMRTRRNLLLASLGAVLLFVPPHYRMYEGFRDGTMFVSLAGVGVFAMYILGALGFIRFLLWLPRRASTWDRRQILYLLPLGAIVSMATSSAGVHTGTYSPFALFLVVFAITSPDRPRPEWLEQSVLAMAAILFVSAAYYKIEIPYLWHTYRPLPLFTGRQWYRHPDYGPMVIEREQLAMFSSLCATIQAGGSEGELLSLPYSYPNYFCNIPPWHGYVQTFFDTTASTTIFGLMDELEKAPPKWIVYQRQLQVLSMHELVYNQGKPLPHRYLDQMIEQKIASGAWRPIYTSSFASYPGLSDEWILLQTR